MIPSETELLTEWDSVRKEANRPFLPAPVWDPTVNTACIDLKTHQSKYSPEFVDKLVAKGVPRDRAIRGLQQHELEHYLCFPYDLGTLLLAQDRLESFGAKANTIEALYSDVKVNLNAVLRGRGDSIMPVLQAAYEKPVLDAIFAFETEIVKYPFDGRSITLPDLVDKLHNVNFYANKRKDQITALTAFAYIIEPYLEDTPPEDKEYSTKDFDPNDIARAVKRMQQEREISPQAAKRILDRHKVKNALEQIALTEASKYPIEVKRKKLSNNAGTYPERLGEWSLDMPIESIDPFNSYGMIVPGMTKIWEGGEYKTYGKEEKMPDVLIALDTSGSMARLDTYPPALTTSLALGQKHILNGSKAAGVNFSDKTKILPATTDMMSLAEFFCDDQNGGTVLDLDKVRSVYNTCKDPDIHIITDAAISNIADVLTYLSAASRRSRPNLWLIGQPGKEYQIPGVKVHYVNVPDDIKKAVIGGQ